MCRGCDAQRQSRLRSVSARSSSSACSRALPVRAAARSNSARGLVAAAELGRAGRRARWAAGGTAAAPCWPRSASTIASPAAGPWCIDTATARLSSTTGDGATLRQRVVERGDARPVGLLGACARARGRRRWRPAARSGPARPAPAPRRASSAARPRRISSRSQRRAVLVGQQHRAAVCASVRAAVREAWISISATRPCTSALLRRQLGQHAAQAQRLVAQRRAHPVVAGGGGVAFVEDQVDHLEHRGQALAPARRRAAPRTARRPRASVRLARTMRCAMVGSGTRKARAISCVVRPPSSAA